MFPTVYKIHVLCAHDVRKRDIARLCRRLGKKWRPEPRSDGFVCDGESRSVRFRPERHCPPFITDDSLALWRESDDVVYIKDSLGDLIFTGPWTDRQLRTFLRILAADPAESGVGIARSRLFWWGMTQDRFLRWAAGVEERLCEPYVVTLMLAPPAET